MKRKIPNLIIRIAPPEPNQDVTDWLAEYAAQLYMMKRQIKRKNNESSNSQKDS